MIRGNTAAAKADRVFLFYIILIVLFGLAALMSASTPAGFSKFNDAYFFVKRQIIFGLIPGLILFLITAKVDYHNWRKLSWALYGMSLILLGLVFMPQIGVTANYSRSWLSFGGVNFQPSEFAKLAAVVMLAHLLTLKKYNWSDWQTSLLPILAILAPSLILILLQPDVGTLSILVVTIFIMLYLVKVPGRYLFFLSLLGIIASIILVLAAPYRAKRLTTFLYPELDPKGVGYQVNQAFLAVGSGGFWGLGFGHSRQKFQYLPEVSADSIYAIIAEENGFLVSTGLVVLILLIAWRGFKIAKSAPDEFGCLLVNGIMIWLVWQSFLNIGAMVGALPLTGVPLPFVSHGGSALSAALAAVGIVANVSKTTRS